MTAPAIPVTVPKPVGVASSSTRGDLLLIAVPVAASLYMAYKANKKKSLTPDGCLTALGVGAIIGVLGGGGTALVQYLFNSHQRGPIVVLVDDQTVKKGSLRKHLVLGHLASAWTNAKTALVDGQQHAGSGSLMGGSATIGMHESITQAKVAAEKSGAMLKDTAFRILGKNSLSALLLRRDINGTILEREPQQLLPFFALLNFFYTSTYWTKKGKLAKEKEIMIESDEVYEASGNRTAKQVLCNGGVAAGLAVIVHFCRMLKNAGVIPATRVPTTADASTGLLRSILTSPVALLDYFATIPNTVLALAIIAQIAAAQGDTWSSEIGVLSKSREAYLIFGGRKVPKGTNGGITVLGTAAALAAGLQLGVTLAVAQFTAMASRAVARGEISTTAVAQYALVRFVKAAIPLKLLAAVRVGVKTVLGLKKAGADDGAVVIDGSNAAAASLVGGVPSSGDSKYVALTIPVAVTGTTLIITCVAAALGGSLLDSVLGQLFQESREIVEPQSEAPTGAAVIPENPSEHAPTTHTTMQSRYVAGFDLLSNHSVNLVTVLFVTVACVAFHHKHPSHFQ